MDAVILHASKASGLFLDLAKNVLDVLLGELTRVVLHVFLSVFIARNELEAEATKEDGSSNAEVLLGVVGLGDGVLVVLLLHELSTDTAGVLITDLIDLDGVITAVEGDDELTVLIIGLSGDELGVESEDVHVLLEHFLHVHLGGLRVEGHDGTKSILLSANTIMFGDGLILHSRGGGGESKGNLTDSESLGVPLLGEVITVEDLAVTAVDLDGSATSDILGHVVLFSTEGHAWAMSEDWLLGELLSLEELREGSATTVLGVDLLDLDGVIAKEEVEGVELVTTIVADISPQDLEAENTTIIVEEALETAVRASTLQFDLNVVLELSLIGRGLLHVDHGASVREGILGVVLRGTDVGSLVGVVRASEFVAVNDAEDTVVDVKVHAESEIGPVVITRAVGFAELGALQENALRDTRVLDSRLDDVEGVVIQVEVDDALSDAEVLSGVLHDGLEEVRLEVEDLNE